MTIKGLPIIPAINSPVLAEAITAGIQNAASTPLSRSQFTQAWYGAFSTLVGALSNFPPAYVTDPQFGAKMDGSDDTAAFQKAISFMATNGGGVIVVPAGTLNYTSVAVPANSAPILVAGAGANVTTLKQTLGNPAGVGVLDVLGSNFFLSDLTIDGGKTSPTGLRYNEDFLGIGGNDPMAPSLSTNTALWLHSGTSNIGIYRVRFQHVGGYSILLDATQGNIDGVDIVNCWFENNRPTLFGTAPTNLNYGSWNGGILVKGDGRTSGSGRCSAVLMEGCRFRRNTGNCFWMHSYGLNSLHSGVRVLGSHFEDCGLDGVLMGAVSGGLVEGNDFLRLGYITLDDSGQPTPRWLRNLNATALDSSGIVKGVPYVGNTFRSINGGCLDLDGHGHSVISANVCKLPTPDEPEYAEDQIAITGPDNNDPGMYGVNTNNTSNTAEGGSDVAVIGNEFLNLPGGSIRLFAARNFLVAANNLRSPDTPLSPPISYGPVGSGPNQRATGNKICHNRIYYNPGSGLPAIFEDASIAPFVATDINHVFGNAPMFPQGTAAIEFLKDVNSGSPSYLSTVWFT